MSNNFECNHGRCSDHAHPQRGGNAGEKNSQCESWRRAPSLARSHAMVQAQISGGTARVDGETHVAKTHQERE